MSVDLPEPETPVTQSNVPKGKSTSTPFRLFPRQPFRRKNLPLPKPLKDKLEQMLTTDMQELIQVSKATSCDFLNLKEKLYRFNYKQYSRYKDNYLDVLTTKISVNAWAQR